MKHSGLAIFGAACLATTSLLSAQEIRTITLTVDEVTQPSLAVSADGKTLYFAILGDLVALPTGVSAVNAQSPGCLSMLSASSSVQLHCSQPLPIQLGVARYLAFTGMPAAIRLRPLPSWPVYCPRIQHRLAASAAPVLPVLKPPPAHLARQQNETTVRAPRFLVWLDCATG